MNGRSAPVASNTAPSSSSAPSDPRLVAYLVAAFASLIGAVVTGRPELVATGAPFAILAAIGLANRQPPRVRGQVKLDSERVLEGDIMQGEVVLDWEGEAELDVIIAALRGVVPVDPVPTLAWTLPARYGPITLPFKVKARVWGRHELGYLEVRARRPGGLTIWEGNVAAGPTLRVLPSPLRLNGLLRPVEPRAIAGAHLSRLRGPGTDFAELRPYVPGDRLRDLSWSTSARLGEPWTIVHHPERTGTVLLLLDAFFEKDEVSREGLARAARAAWAVAAAHLRVQDRVGLLAVGRTTAWLPPRGGRRARWLLLDELLTVGRAAEDLRYRRGFARPTVPADALVVGVTGLRSLDYIRDLVHHRRAGHTTVALVIDTVDLLPPPSDRLDSAAQRLWQAERDAVRHRLDRSGVPTALVTAAEGVGPAISLLGQATNRRHGARPGIRTR